MFFGFYLSAATMVVEETGAAVPELARRMTLTSCALDPVRALAAVLTRMAAVGTGLATSWMTPATPTASRCVGDPPLRVAALKCGSRLVIDRAANP